MKRIKNYQNHPYGKARENRRRNIVAEKPVLAYILKSALDEYEGYTVQEIAEKFIESVPQIRTAAVHRDHPD